MKELAADGIPVAVSCRVLKLSRAPYYRWLKTPVSEAELVEAYRANALFDAHADDPQFGHRLLADEARDSGQDMCEPPRGRSAQKTSGGHLLGRRKARMGRNRARQFMMICVRMRISTALPATGSKQTLSMTCGSRTFLSTQLEKASSIFAPSRMHSRGGSWGIPSDLG